MNPTNIPAINTWLASQGAAGRIAVRDVIIEDDLFPRLQDLLHAAGATHRPLLVIMDHTPMRRANDNAKTRFLQIANRIAEPTLISLGTPADPPHADLDIARRLATRLPPRALIISFGSGTITDLAKHARFLADQNAAAEDRRTFVSIPTACTVTAFSSALAVLGVAGVKRTIPSQNPDCVWIDLPLLAGAPMELTRAGVGDLLARGVAYADWYLSSLLDIDESYTDTPRLLLAGHEASLPDIAAALARREPAAFRRLMEALLLAGYAMSVVGQTTPISGWEHVMSHYLDLCNTALHKPLNLHGLQVAAGTFTATRAYNQFLRETNPDDLAAAADTDLAGLAHTQITRHFAPIDPSGHMRGELLRDYLPKAHRWQAARLKLSELAAQWPSGRPQKELADRLMPLDKLTAIARALDIPRTLTALDSLPAASSPSDTVKYAHLVRRRFTLGDLLSALNWLDNRRVATWLST